MLKDILNKINNGSATTDDYAEFFALFNTPITNPDGSYRPLYDIFVEAHENYEKGNINTITEDN